MGGVLAASPAMRGGLHGLAVRALASVPLAQGAQALMACIHTGMRASRVSE